MQFSYRTCTCFPAATLQPYATLTSFISVSDRSFPSLSSASSSFCVSSPDLSLTCSGKLIPPDKNLTTDQKLNKIGILSLHKQLDYNKDVFMYKALTNNAPVYISSLYDASHSSSKNNYLQLPKPKIDLFKTNIAFSGALFWNSLPVHLRSCHSLSSFRQILREQFNTTV